MEGLCGEGMGREGVGTASPGFRWESHCRLLSSGGQEESGEAGRGGKREGHPYVLLYRLLFDIAFNSL